MSQTKIQMGPLQIAIILLTVATAVVHLTLVFPSPLFILNGLGYLALLAALYLPIPQLTGHRQMIRWAFIGYTALTVVLWVIMGSRIPIAYIDKVIEVVLILLLLMEGRQSSS
jgi:hypothetical protein